MTAAATIPERRAFPLWIVVAFGGLLTAIALGIRSTFGVFVDPISDGLFSGEKGPFALAIAIQSIVWGLSQPIAGAISDRFGAALTYAAGLVLFGISMFMMSISTTTGMLVLSTGLLVGIGLGAASFSVVLSAVGRMVTAEKRPMALGIVSAIGSIGQFFLVPLARWLINRYSWETTAVIFAVTVVTTIVLTPSLRGSARRFFPEPANEHGIDRTLRQELRRAAHAKPYLLLNAAFFVCGFHVTFIGTFLPSYGEDLGHADAAVLALGLIGLFNVFGSLAAGALGGRYSKTKLLAGIYAMRAIVIAVYVIAPKSGLSTIIFGCAIGVLWLSTVPLTSAMVSEQFGTAHSGALFGIVFVAHQFGALAGALLGGNLRDAYGSYDVVWWLAVALGVLAMVLHLMITEGPVPEPPPAAASSGRLAPAGGLATFVLLVGILSALVPVRSADAAPATLDDSDEFVLGWCGPT